MSCVPWGNETEKAEYFRKQSADLLAENERLQAALQAAEKCIYDTETYLDLGSGKYAYKAIKEYRSKKPSHAPEGGSTIDA